MPFEASQSTALDPDRFINFGTPGSQEWWYFDAISDDGRDALVAVWYAGLPFDPAYGVAALKHGRAPHRHQAPHPLDHCALGLSWYHEGKPVAYALNAYKRDRFNHRSEPFGVSVAANHLTRQADGQYRLEFETPAVDGRRKIQGELTFTPTAGTRPIERDLGHAGSPHLWMLAAPDCRVAGTLSIGRGKGDRSLTFQGRGYHDHNAGSEEISLAMRRWHWGRVHMGPATHVYYHATTQQGESQSLWITLDQVKPPCIRETPFYLERPGKPNRFGVPSDLSLALNEQPAHQPGPLLMRIPGTCVDDGPFYRRFLSTFILGEGPFDNGPPRPTAKATGFSELLDTRNLNSPWFNWMIPFRLKRPRS